MDLLTQCAVSFEKLLDKQYNIVLGHKGKLSHFSLRFDKSHFHHIIGLNKIKDIDFLRTASRVRIYDDIIKEQIKYADIKKSTYFDEMSNRIEYVIQLEELLDSNELVFSFREKDANGSKIQAIYLMKSVSANQDVYIFIDKEPTTETYFCRTFFPKERIDFTQGQTRYTLLFKEKEDIPTGIKTVQYDKLSPKR